MQLKIPVFNHEIKCFRTSAKSNALSNKKTPKPTRTKIKQNRIHTLKNNFPQTQIVMQGNLGKSNFLSQTLKDKNITDRIKALNLDAVLRFITKCE